MLIQTSIPLPRVAMLVRDMLRNKGPHKRPQKSHLHANE